MPHFHILPTCSICHDDASLEDHVITLCGHIFHSPCIRQWDQTQRKQGRTTKCPTCCSVLRRIGGERPNGPLGSRFVKLHSLTDRAFDRDSSPPIPDPSKLTDRYWKEKHDLKNVVSDQRRRLEELELLPEKLRAEGAALRAQLERAERQLEQAGRLAAEANSKHRKAIATERQGRADDRTTSINEMSRMKRQMDDMTSLCTRLRTERHDLQKQLEKQTRELEETTENMVAFSAEVDVLRESRARLESEMKTMKATVFSMQQRSAAFEHKYEKSKNLALALRKQLEDLQSCKSNNRDTQNQKSITPVLKKSPSTPESFSARLLERTFTEPELTPLRNTTLKSSPKSMNFSTSECQKKRSVTDLETLSPNLHTLSAGPGKRRTRHRLIDLSSQSMPEATVPTKDAASGIVLPSLFGAEPLKRSGLRLVFAQRSLGGSGSNTLPTRGSSKLVALGPKIRKR